MESLGGQDPGLVTNWLEQHSHEQHSPNSAWYFFGAVLGDSLSLLLPLLILMVFLFESWKFHHSSSRGTRHFCHSMWFPVSQDHQEAIATLCGSLLCLYLPRGILLVEIWTYAYFLVVKGPRTLSFAHQLLSLLAIFLEKSQRGTGLGNHLAKLPSLL